MPNTDFFPELSTDAINVGSDFTECLTDTLAEMQADIEGKAEANHEHEGYAVENHTHNEYSLFDHTHTAAQIGAIAKTLQFTNDNGSVEYSFGVDSEKNILTEINSWEVGFHTAYAVGNTEGNPTVDSYRYLVHKTNPNIGWVLAFSGQGEVYTNYEHNGVWRGWRKLYTTNDTAANVLWAGARYMNAGHTITPSKKLSECRNGWMLEWSDYDSDTDISNNYNIVHTPIYKRNVAGDWNGQNMMICVPNYVTNDGTTTTYVIKQLFVYDDKIVGHALNSTGSTNIDVVLRAVYEF